MPTLQNYVLITPARNEAEFISATLDSVVGQTLRPVKWIVVSDGSTDGTDEIVKKYAASNPWIELLRMPEREQRHFAGKVHAFNAGYARLKDVKYEVLGSLDGDISFGPGYFSFLIQKLEEDKMLGLVGTPFEGPYDERYDYRFVSIEHVSGACQLFRRECFEAIGGFLPMKGGGVDYVAVLGSRMKGWKTRTFTEQVCLHHRKMGTAEMGILRARFRNGVKDYVLGSSPLWQIFRTFYQMTKRPLIFGGLGMAAGYLWAAVGRMERPISKEMMAFRRREEMQRLKRFLYRGKSIDVSRHSPSSISI